MSKSVVVASSATRVASRLSAGTAIVVDELVGIISTGPLVDAASGTDPENAVRDPSRIVIVTVGVISGVVVASSANAESGDPMRTSAVTMILNIVRIVNNNVNNLFRSATRRYRRR